MDTLGVQKEKQVVREEIRPETSLEAKIMKLKLFYFGYI